ncbi:hypothetical protein H5410_027796 [Solanum commersonii]|uniref:Uncharacterized protein n=1 Tax=Solanum commersonii TaxID=4109 RepID=A0A9J5Z2X1_SOLCO|nr:hypothetical protein H5410_027796 [Solanum commersonii]
MTTNIETAVNQVDSSVDLTTRDSPTVKENRTLRNVMAQLCQAWANSQEPLTSIPGFPKITKPSKTCPQGTPSRNNPTITTIGLVYTLPQPTGAIEKLIDHGVVVVRDDKNTPNVTNNPLPAQNNVHLVGKLLRKIGEEDESLKSLEPIASLSVESVTLDTKVLCPWSFEEA